VHSLAKYRANSFVFWVGPVILEGDTLKRSVLPVNTPNMVYVDGPAEIKNCRGGTDLPLIESQLPLGCVIVFDQQERNLALHLERFQRTWKHWTREGWFRIAKRQNLLELLSS